MKIEKYHLKSDNTLTYFEFISAGSKGAIRKMIEFQILLPQIFSILLLVIKILKQAKLMI